MQNCSALIWEKLCHFVSFVLLLMEVCFIVDSKAWSFKDIISILAYQNRPAIPLGLGSFSLFVFSSEGPPYWHSCNFLSFFLFSSQLLTKLIPSFADLISIFWLHPPYIVGNVIYGNVAPFWPFEQGLLRQKDSCEKSYLFNRKT